MQNNNAGKLYCLADSSGHPLSNEILFPYAWDEWMCRQLANDHPNYIHIWQHPKAIVLGLRDRQLPYIQQAASWAESNGYVVAVRNSGGAAVPLDQGVVNISLLIGKLNRSLNFRDDFETMIELLREALLPWSADLQVGEIKGSYCPGDYDLSIGGLKFCGIAQRRQAHGYVVQAFVNVESSGAERAEWIRTFYEIASRGGSNFHFPIIEDNRVSSLQELIGVPSAQHFIERLMNLQQVKHPATQLAKEVLHNELFPTDPLAEAIIQLKKRYALGSL